MSRTFFHAPAMVLNRNGLLSSKDDKAFANVFTSNAHGTL